MFPLYPIVVCLYIASNFQIYYNSRRFCDGVTQNLHFNLDNTVYGTSPSHLHRCAQSDRDTSSSRLRTSPADSGTRHQSANDTDGIPACCNGPWRSVDVQRHVCHRHPVAAAAAAAAAAAVRAGQKDSRTLGNYLTEEEEHGLSPPRHALRYGTRRMPESITWAGIACCDWNLSTGWMVLGDGRPGDVKYANGNWRGFSCWNWLVLVISLMEMLWMVQSCVYIFTGAIRCEMSDVLLDRVCGASSNSESG